MLKRRKRDDESVEEPEAEEAEPGAAPEGGGEAPLAAGNPSRMRLGEMMLKEGVITQGQLDAAVELREKQGGFLGQALVQLECIDQRTLVSFLVKQCKIPHINLQDYGIAEEVVGLVPKDICRKYQLLPIDKMGKMLTVAMVDPLDLEALDEVRKACPDLRIKPILCDWNHFESAAARLFSDKGKGQDVDASSFGLAPQSSSEDSGGGGESPEMDAAVAALLAEAEESQSPSTETPRPGAGPDDAPAPPAQGPAAVPGMSATELAAALREALGPLVANQSAAAPIDAQQLAGAMRESIREAMGEMVAPLMQAQTAAQGADGGEGPSAAQMMAGMQQSMRDALKEAVAPLAEAAAKDTGPDPREMMDAMRQAMQEAVAPLAQAQAAASDRGDGPDAAQMMAAMRQSMREAMQEAVAPLAQAAAAKDTGPDPAEMMAAMRQALQEAVAPLAQAQTSSSSTKGDGPDPAQLIAAMQQSMREAMKEAVAPLAQAAAAKEQGPDAAALAAAMRQAVQEAVAPLAQAASAKDQGPDPAQMMAAMQQSMREAMKEAIEPLAKAQSKGGKTKGDSLDAGQLTSAMQDAVKEAVAPLAKAQHETAAAQNVEAGTESQIAEAMRQLLGAFQASQTQQEEKLGAMASAATRAAEAAEAALNASREQRASVAEPADTRGRNIAPLPQHGDESNAAVTQVSSAALAALDDAGGGGASHKLSGAMTFETLTPSRANEFALKAAQAIAKSPDSGYNPFFVGGKVGLGKTHLVTAIANAARSANPDLRLAMFPASRFAGDLAECSLGERDERRESLAALDLLILDDVQYLAERADAQEELFHILNAMSDGGRQVVLAADRAPERLPGFSDRLLSRFAGGLSVTLKPPEYAARRAILQRLAKEAKAKIDDEVLALIATRVSQDVRRMCGALKKVIAFAQLQGEAVGYDVADEIINQMSDIEAA